MIQLVAWRLIAAIPVLLVVAVSVFCLVRIAPGDVASLIAGDTATVEQIEAIRKQMHLDDPMLTQFAVWLSGICRGEWGTSVFTGRPVLRLISERIEPSLLLAVYSLALATLIAIPLGVMAAAFRRTAIDRLAMFVSLIGFSTPVFVIAYALVYVFSIQLRWFPVQGYAPVSQGFASNLSTLALPAVTLALVHSALVARVTRAAMAEVLLEEYIRSAKAKGISFLRVILFHALKNAGIPIVTVIGLGFASLIGGVVVTESIFNIPGLGRLTVDAILRRDYPVVQGVLLFCALLLVGTNIVVDITYPHFDPRLRRVR